MPETTVKTPENLETDRLDRLNGITKGPGTILQPTVVRLADDGRWWVMNNKAQGWSSFGVPFLSLPSVARRYALDFVRFSRDECSFYVEVSPVLAPTIADEKGRLIEAILENRVYTPDSGLVRNLRQKLAKMSKSDLSALQLIVDLKVSDAEGTDR